MNFDNIVFPKEFLRYKQSILHLLSKSMGKELSLDGLLSALPELSSAEFSSLISFLESIGVSLIFEESLPDDASEPDVSDSVHLYLTEAGQYPLLTSEDEISLGRRIAEGDAEARDLMIKCNLRLVIHIAKQFQGRGLPFLDLIQEGNIGLLKAVDKFDCEKGCRFSTHAYYWIWQAIGRSIANTGRVVRLPSHVCRKIKTLNKTFRELTLELGHEPDDTDLALRLGCSQQEIGSLTSYQKDILSLEQPVSDTADSAMYGDFIPDLANDDPLEIASYNELCSRIDNLLDTLSDNEKDILIKRFGLHGELPKTLQEIGREYGLSRERIRQLEVSGLRKLRHPLRRRQLAGYLD